MFKLSNVLSFLLGILFSTFVMFMLFRGCLSCSMEDKSEKGFTLYIGGMEFNNSLSEMYLHTSELRIVWGDEEYLFEDVDSLNRFIAKQEVEGIDLWY